MKFFRHLGIVALAVLAIAVGLVAPVAASPPAQPDVGIDRTAAIAANASESVSTNTGAMTEVMSPCVMSSVAFGKFGLAPAHMNDLAAAGNYDPNEGWAPFYMPLVNSTLGKAESPPTFVITEVQPFGVVSAGGTDRAVGDRDLFHYGGSTSI